MLFTVSTRYIILYMKYYKGYNILNKLIKVSRKYGNILNKLRYCIIFENIIRTKIKTILKKYNSSNIINLNYKK